MIQSGQMIFSPTEKVISGHTAAEVVAEITLASGSQRIMEQLV